MQTHPPIAAAARVSRYHLTPESRAVIAQHAANIRANLHWRRALRQAQEAVQSTRRGVL